jgi:hypothetical protein
LSDTVATSLFSGVEGVSFLSPRISSQKELKSSSCVSSGVTIGVVSVFEFSCQEFSTGAVAESVTAGVASIVSTGVVSAIKKI